MDEMDRKHQMDRFLHHTNLEHFRKQLANANDEVKRQTLLELLTAEEKRPVCSPRPHNHKGVTSGLQSEGELRASVAG